MAYIVPNSVVKLLWGVNLDKSYNHTIYFENATNQYNYFASKCKPVGNYNHTYSKNTYQRVNRNTIRLGVVADDIYDCNYMMFQNTNYGNKWFYAFINEVNYINDVCTEIVYEIDVMQTWYFDYELGDCFIEREHTLTDVIGENLVPEDVNIGEYILHSASADTFSGVYMGGFITSQRLPCLSLLYDPEAIGIPYFPTVTKANAPCGVSSGLYIYGGFPVDEKGVELYTDNPLGYMSSLNHKTAPPAPLIQDPFAGKYLLSQMLPVIASGDAGVDEDCVVSTFQVPIEFFENGHMSDQAWSDANLYGLTSTGAITLTRPTKFKSGIGLTDYEPCNNKMLTFPYIKCLCTNLQGNTADYKFEDFPQGEAGVRWIGTIFPTANLYAVPTTYKRFTRCYDEGVSITNMPVPAWKGDKFGQWLNQQGNSTLWGMLGSALSGIASLATGGVGALPAAGMGLVRSVGSVIAKGIDLSHTPPATYMQVSNNSLTAAAKQVTIKLYAMCIKRENAEIIDRYFSMFGYAVNLVKKPNIRTASVSALRKHWNYVKTHGCIIHAATNSGATVSGLPSDAEDKIAQIYDNGITYWMNGNEVGEYTANMADNGARS